MMDADKNRPLSPTDKCFTFGCGLADSFRLFRQNVRLSDN